MRIKDVFPTLMATTAISKAKAKERGIITEAIARWAKVVSGWGNRKITRRQHVANKGFRQNLCPNTTRGYRIWAISKAVC